MTHPLRRFILGLSAILALTVSSYSQNRTHHSGLGANLFVSEVLTDTIFSDIGANLPGSFAGNATWFDFDNDGKLDILCSGYNDTAYFTKIYRNEGGVFVDISAQIPGLGTERGVSWGDYDNDGDVDIAIQGRTDPQNVNFYTKIYRNDNGTFVDIGANLVNLNGGSTTWVDYDNDGRLDLFVCGSTDNGNNFASVLYRQDENGVFSIVPTPFIGVWGSSASWGDYDNDGDQDLFLMGYGNSGAITKLYRNDGGTFVDTQIPFYVVVEGASSWVDIDNDGDLDLTYNGAANGSAHTLFYRNLGGGNFEEIPSGIKDLSVSALSWGDFDNDGDLDVAESGSEFFDGTNPTTKIYRNDGGTFVDIGTTIPGVWFGTLAWGDYDNDGKLDLLVTGGQTPVEPGSITHPITRIYRNGISIPNTLPSTPQHATAIVGQNETQIAWDPATDGQTPSSGLTYNVRVGSTPGAADIVDPLSTGSGIRRVPTLGNTGFNKTRMIASLPAGTYYWSVQSVDNGFAGSTFAQEQSFVVPDSATDTQLFSVTGSWNLISVPRDALNKAATTLYPTASSSAFGYSGTGYVTHATLQNGAGYWMKFPSAQVVTLKGAPRLADTLTLGAGWNMIGGLSVPVLTAGIGSIPGGITTSSFFGYGLGYATSTTLEPGKGYWVKMSQAGQLVFQSGAAVPSQNRVQIVVTGEQPPPPPWLNAVKPTAYRLAQNYPNPFNPSTIIDYTLLSDGPVRITVYDVLGREVVKLVDEVQRAGFKSITFDAASLSAGVYTYVLRAGSFSESKKMTLMK